MEKMCCKSFLSKSYRVSTSRIFRNSAYPQSAEFQSGSSNTAFSVSEAIITAHNDLGLTPVDPEIADTVDWSRHACKRTCRNNASSLDCYYTFKLESYEAMSKACYDCPFNITDCFRPHCIPVDGIMRSLLSVNRQLPGPPIEVRYFNLLTSEWLVVLTRIII